MPVLTSDQRRAASAKAVAARQARARISVAVKRGDVAVASVLERAETDEALAGMRVLALLESLPRYGPTRAARALELLRIAPSRRLRGIGATQRAALLALIGETR
ncbi:MAG: putative integration host factor MihF [Pseudonocardiales bacterium]|nr:putative integration host factor MihF [Pseudonocardiales bacterium]